MNDIFYNKQIKRLFFISLFIQIIAIPFGILTARMMAKIITYATNGETKRVLAFSLFLLMVVVGVKTFENTAKILFKKKMAEDVHNSKIKLYKCFLSNPLYFLFSCNYGDSVKKLNKDFDVIIEKSTVLFPTLYTGIIMVIAYFIYLSYYDLLLAILMLGISLLQIVPPMLVKRVMAKNYVSSREKEAQITNFLMEGYDGFADIKVYQLKNWFLQKLKGYQDQLKAVGSKSIYTFWIENGLNSFIDNILKYGLYAIAGILILLQITSIETSIQAITLSGSFFGAVKSVFSVFPQLSVAASAEKRVSSLFIEEREIRDKMIETPDININNLSFSFDEKQIYENLNISFDCNRISLIKGANGTGKSTLLHLIVGALKSDKGDIFVGGSRSGDCSDTNFPQNLFYLPQEDANFNFTSIDLYQMVLKQSENVLRLASEFKLTNNILQTPINNLSGGERKKVFLSLAFALDPIVLLLDEPINSLDTESIIILKKLILERKSRHKGVIIVTHGDTFDDISDYHYIIEEDGIHIEKR